MAGALAHQKPKVPQTAAEVEALVRAGKMPRCLEVAKRGINTSKDFASYMSAMMSDLIEGTVTPQIGNAACNAGGKLLKVVEMEYKYGTTGKNGQPKHLTLVPGGDKKEDDEDDPDKK